MSMFKRERDPYQESSAQAANTPPPPPEPVAAVAVKEAPPPAVAPAKPPEPAVARVAVLPVKREDAAVVDKQTDVKGTLHSEGNVLVEGTFDGEIEAKQTVWIDKGALAQAKLMANDVVISGTFDGEIDCRHRLQIAATASVSGEIRTPVLVIEEGATVNCRFAMTKHGGEPR